MTPDKERPNVVPWPPIVLGTALVAGFALGWFFPGPWPEGLGPAFLQALGGLLVATALVLFFTARQAFLKASTTLLPHRAASHLVTNGPFAISRNPIYLANVILLFGLGFLFGNIWFFPLALVAGFTEHKLAIEREEAHLEHKFGKAWRDYKRRVRPWI